MKAGSRRKVFIGTSPYRVDNPTEMTVRGSNPGRMAAWHCVDWSWTKKRTSQVSNGKLKNTVSSLMDRLFRDREIFLRSDGKVSYLQVSRRVQKTVAVVVLSTFVWLGYASVNVIFHHQIVASKVVKIEQQKLEYFDLLTEVSEYHEQFSRITRNLEENQTYLLSLLAKSGQDIEDLADVEWQLKDSMTEHARLRLSRDELRDRLETFDTTMSRIARGSEALRAKARSVIAAFALGDLDAIEPTEARDALGRRIDMIEGQLTEVSEYNTELQATVAGLTQEMAVTEQVRAALQGDKAALNTNVAGLESDLGQAGQRQSLLEEQIAILESSLGEATGQNENLVDERTFLNTRISGLEQRLTGMRDTQQQIVNRLTEQTLASIDTYEQTVAMTGVDADSLLVEFELTEVAAASAVSELAADQGGPFIPGDYVAEEDPSQALESSINLLDLQMDRWQGLQTLVRSLPIIAPLDQFRITSRFGPRHDPVNNRKSNHHGLDLGAPTHSPVMSPAPGRVRFAGWKGRYGRVIEIDHGNGIRTRYAHLRKILVKKGQEVEHREKIGLVGSSGRSTGPHLHYEVLVNGKPLDPMNFLKAGQHVFKG